MNNKRIIKNIGISMIMKPISMLLSFVYVPLALAYLGQEKYGVWAIVLNIVSWINYFDIGIANGLRNKLTESLAKDNKSDANIYVSTAYIATMIISAMFCVLVITIWLLLNLSAFFNLELIDESVNAVIFVSILFVCINFILSLSKTCAYSIQIPGIISVIGVMGQILQIAIIWILGKTISSTVFAVALMYGLVSLIDNIIIYFYVTKKRNYLVPKLRSINRRYVKPLLTLGLGFFVLQICSLVLNTTDNLLISSLYGSAEVTPYSMVYKVFYIAVQVHAIIIMPMWSAYTEAATRKDLAWIKNTMKKINMVTSLLSVGVIVGIFLFEPFSEIWLGTRLEYGKPLIVIVAIYMIAQMFGNNYSAFLCGVGYINVSTIISVIGTILNIPLSILFAQALNMRLAGIILGSLCVMAISVVVLPVVSINWVNRKEIEWKNHDKFIQSER